MILNISTADIIGYIASVCMVLGYLPQTIHTIKTRKTDDIALGTFLLMGIGGFFFGLYRLHLLLGVGVMDLGCGDGRVKVNSHALSLSQHSYGGQNTAVGSIRTSVVQVAPLT